MSEETQCSTCQLVNKRISYVLTPHMLYVKFSISCFQFTKKLMNMQKTKTPRMINPAAKLGKEIVSKAHIDMAFPLTFILTTTHLLWCSIIQLGRCGHSFFFLRHLGVITCTHCTNTFTLNSHSMRSQSSFFPDLLQDDVCHIFWENYCSSPTVHPITKGKGVSVHAMRAYMGSRGSAPLILNLNTTQKSVFSFTNCYTPREGAVDTHWNTKLGGP